MTFLLKRENYNIVMMPGFSYLGSLILTYAIVCVSEVAKGELEHVLNHYETLNVKDVFHSVHKRDTAFQEKILSFTALGRHFRLHLTPNKDLFDEEFHAYSVGPNDVKTEIPINKDSFYRGYDEDDASSEASVHDDYGVLTASIAMKNDTYIIEPAWRHLRKSSNEQMIAYRHSDVKSNITHSHNNPKDKKYSFCGHDSEHSTVYYKENVAQDFRSHRRKRAVSTLIRCSLALVADYRFHQEMGQRDRSKTVNYMIGVADRVNTIFQRTEWSSEYRGYGFEIAQVIVHEDSFPAKSGHYNQLEDVWEIKDLLKAFSLNREWKNYCLAHLFTYRDFKDGVIGLAYVGNRKRNAVGGICTEDYFTENKWLYLNTGLSSTINWGRKLLTEEADIVTAHEIGHNFGSEHDPDTAECAPGDTRAEGGKFIMYPASVSGQLQNNKEFSPCSKRRILGVLQSKSQFCFTEPRNEICGNYKKEANEECDPGGISPIDTQCCTKNCKLQPDAVCSDGYDSPCCINCVYNNVSIKCREEDPTSCKKETYCNGSSPSCPEAESMDDGTVCLDSGKCLKGECLSLCAAENLNPCKCTEQQNACKVCCVISGRCQPHKDNVTGATVDVPNGRTCETEEFQGACDNQECKKSTQDFVERFWTFLTTLDSDKFAKFMKDNLAGTVLFFSLVIWIPASCYISHQDRKRDEQEALEAEWRDKRSTKLLREPKPTSKGKFIYRQESISRSSKAHKPYKVKATNIKTNRRLKLEQVRETDF